MYKLLFTCTLLIIGATVATAQQQQLQNNIYFEGAGNGGWSSINYERQLTQKPGFSLRVGMGMYTENGFYMSLPMSLHYLFAVGKRTNYIDAGLGVTLFGNDAKFGKNSSDRFTSFTPSVGYRIHTNSNVMFRFSLTPIINITNDAFTPWAGISIGKRF